MPLRGRPKPFSPHRVYAPLDRVEESLSFSVVGVEGEDEMEPLRNLLSPGSRQPSTVPGVFETCQIEVEESEIYEGVRQGVIETNALFIGLYRLIPRHMDGVMAISFHEPFPRCFLPHPVPPRKHLARSCSSQFYLQ